MQDIFVDLPGIANDLDDWELLSANVELPEIVTQTRSELRASILDHLRRLVEWRWKFEEMNPSVAQAVRIDPSTSMIIDENTKPLFQTVFHFTDLDNAQTIILYNVIFLWLIKASSRVFDKDPFTISMIPSLGTPPARTNPLNLPGRDPIDATSIVHEICRNLEYRVLRVTSSAVAFPLLLPLRISMLCSDAESEEAKWLMRLAGIIEQRSGLEVKSLITERGRAGIGSLGQGAWKQ